MLRRRGGLRLQLPRPMGTVVSECPRCGAGRAKNTPCLCGYTALQPNSFLCTSCSWAVPDVPDAGDADEPECPACGAAIKMISMLRGTVQTTWPRTAQATQYATYVRLRKSTRVIHKPGLTWAFTDGATRGSYAAAILLPDGSITDHSRYVGKWHLPQANVTAEVMGVALALRHSPVGTRVNVVSDYVGTGCWLHGKWRIKNHDCLRRLRLIARLIRKRRLDVVFIHHKGHQKDDSDFTRLNNRADRLCEEAAHGR